MGIMHLAAGPGEQPDGRGSTSGAPALRLTGLAPVIAAAAGATAAGAIAIQAALGDPALSPVVLAAVAVLVLALSFTVYAYARGMAAFREAVHRVGDGSLSRMRLPPASRPLMGELADEFDTLARHLSTLFGEMEQAQLSIITERNRHEAILQGLPGALLVVDDDLRVTLSNQKAEQLFGLPGDALEGAGVFDLLRVDTAGRDLIRDAFLNEEQVTNRVLPLTVGERLHHVSLNMTFFSLSPRQAQACAAIILQDITDWKRLEDMTRQAKKLVAMGQLAAGVAHELNTPLGTILGYARLLDEGKADASRRAEYAGAIQQEAKRCARIVDQLLAYARRDACHAETCDVNALIRETVEAVSQCQGERHCVRVEADVEGFLPVRGAQGQIDIVLVNVMVNAVQAAAGRPEPWVRVSSRADGERATVSITDNGPGVPREICGKIFDPFFTTKAGGTGTGLGLAISHSLVTRIGGSIRCDPDWRNGARFEIVLPLATPEGAECR